VRDKAKTLGYLGGSNNVDVLTGVAQTGVGQIHIFAKSGNDTVNLKFANNINKFSSGHHVRGDGSSGIDDSSIDRGNDIFNFQDIGNVSDGDIIVGRIEDFDAHDKIKLENITLDFDNCFGHVRVVEFNGAHNDAGTTPQQWLLITTPTAGYIFYALEGARVDMDGNGGSNNGNFEKHFLSEDDLPPFASLKDVIYVDPQNYVPAGFIAQGGIVVNDDDENASHVNTKIFGTFNSDLIAAGLNDDVVSAGGGNDRVWGGSGDDIMTGDAGDDTLWGGRGNDTAQFNDVMAAVTVIINANGTVCVTDQNGTDTLSSVETLAFTDRTLDMKSFSSLTQLSNNQFKALAEMYVAYFNRAPDAEGLFFWADKLAEGRTMDQIAENFFDQDETRKIYTDPSNTDAFVKIIYDNVLGRTPDTGGFNFWQDRLAEGDMTQGSCVLKIIEGAKNGGGLSDATYLSNKADLGIYYSAIKGLSDGVDGRQVLAAFGDQATANKLGAKASIDKHYIDATSDAHREFLFKVAGVVDNPFVDFA
jgi:hypothetical protein